MPSNLGIISSSSLYDSILSQATSLWQAKNFSGSGAWLDEVGYSHFQLGSVGAAYIGKVNNGSNALVLPGVAGNYAFSPDSAPLSITGGLTIDAHVSLTDWTPSTIQSLVTKWSPVASDKYSYFFGVNTNGSLLLAVSSTGTNVLTVNSAILSVSNGASLWVRVSFTPNNGSNQYETRFWTSPDGVTWTQLGSTSVVGGAISIFDSTAILSFGYNQDEQAGATRYPLVGNLHRAKIYATDLGSNNGFPVLDANFSAQTAGSTSFTESSGNAAIVTVVSTSSDASDPSFLPYSTNQNPFGVGVKHVNLPGLTGNYVSTADDMALDITGNIELITKISVTSWSAGTRALISKHGSLSGDYGPYAWRLNADGKMFIGLAPNSTSFQSVTSTAGLSGALTKWLRATVTLSGCTTRFYYSNDTTNDPTNVSWTQLGSDVTTASIASLNSSNNPVCIGTWSETGTSDMFSGSISRALVYNGIGGSVVADFNPNTGTISANQSTLTGTGDGLTWTFNRASSGRKLAVVNEDKFLLGGDDYFTQADNPTFDFGTDDFTAIVRFRANESGTSTYPIIFGQGSSGAWGILMQESLNSAYAQIFNSSYQAYVSGNAETTATWTVARAGDNLYLQRDSTRGTAKTGVDSLNLNSTDPVRVGERASQYLDGEITALAIFKGRALTTQEAIKVMSELS